jgi:RES domain-containing protein
VKLWRISNYSDLGGMGGLRNSGRWHNRGLPVVYLAESAALAMLEVLVHFSADADDDIPDNFQLLEIDYSNGRSISALQLKSLPETGRRPKILLLQSAMNGWQAATLCSQSPERNCPWQLQLSS